MNSFLALEQLYIFILCIPRFAMALLFIPFLSPQALGGSMIRNAILIGFAVFVYPVVSSQLAAYDIDRVSMLRIMFQETVIGLTYGFFIGLPFVLVNSLGGILDIQRGSMMSQIFNPGLGATSTEMATFMNTVFSYMFFSLGPFLVSIGVILKSYTLIPVSLGGIVLSGEVLNAFAQGFQGAMLSATTFVAPVIMIIFFVDFGLGLVNRFSPALNVFMLSLSIKSWIAIFMVLILFNTLLNNFNDFTQANLLLVEDLWKLIVPK